MLMVPTNNTDDDGDGGGGFLDYCRPSVRSTIFLQSASNDFVVKISSKSRFDIRGKN